MKYEVTLHYHTSVTLTVSAGNEEQAIIKARNKDMTDELLQNLEEDRSPETVTLPEETSGDPFENYKNRLASAVRRCGYCNGNHTTLLTKTNRIKFNGNTIEEIRCYGKDRIVLIPSLDNMPGTPIDLNIMHSDIKDTCLPMLKEMTEKIEDLNEIEPEDPDDDDTVPEPQPLFSEEVIESLHIGSNNLSIGMLYASNEEDVERGKEYLRELNRRHLAGEPLQEPTMAEARETLTKTVKKHGMTAAGGNIQLDTFTICSDKGIEVDGSTIDRVELIEGVTLRLYYNVNTNNYAPVEHFNPSEVMKFAEAINEYFAGNEQ